MAEKHPYSPSASGLVRTVDQLRRTFPPKVDVGALKKLATAPKNEGQVLQILKFINVLDDNFSKTDIASSVFTMHNVEDFRKGLSGLVKNAYKDIFTLHGNDAWTLPLDKLISYFRGTDQTSVIVGKRQALTFQTFAELCGYQPEIQAKQNGGKKSQDSKTSLLKQKARKQKPQSSTPNISLPSHGKETNQGFGLTVRVEINLPAVGDQDTYDKIFKSIKENLLNG
jgi:hypothetical protein